MKKLNYFHSVEPVDSSGIVAWSPFIEAEQVIEAYEHGVFPWPEAYQSIYWFSPLKRGVLEFKDLKWTKKEIKFLNKCNFEFRINFDFEAMIKTCAEVKAEIEEGTWITEDLIEAYLELNKKNIAISFEVYELDELVGGMYGVFSEKYFSAESMFYKKSNASKYAIFKAVEFLKLKGLSWIDTQVVTDFTSRLGAKEISRKQFLLKIK
jgi:leucyl/phenylalanyl-tRNA---protein transferase